LKNLEASEFLFETQRIVDFFSSYFESIVSTH